MREATVWVVLFLCAGTAAAEEERDPIDGMEAAVRGDWVTACELFDAAGDVKSSSRLRAAREQAMKRLVPAVDRYLKEKRWEELAGVVACGLAVHPTYHRFTSAAKRLEREEVPVPPLGAHMRPAGTYGADWIEAQRLERACVDFLVRTQEESGGWKAEKYGAAFGYDTGVTALALLALLPERREAADRAVTALLGMQKEGGIISAPRTNNWMYAHVFALEALAEYACLTDRQAVLAEPLRDAVAEVLAAQNPGAGWRYVPRGGDSDTSLTSRALSALVAARRAGVDVPDDALGGAVAWILAMTDPFGRIGYNQCGGACARPDGLQARFPAEQSEAMTAAGCFAYMLCGADPCLYDPGLGLIEATPPRTPADIYYWECGARSLVAARGCIPEAWFGALVKSAGASLAEDGALAANDVWREAGRLYANAMCARALAAPLHAPAALPRTARAFRETRRRVVRVDGSAVDVPTGIYVDSGTVLRVTAEKFVRPFERGPPVDAGGTREKLRGSNRVVTKSASFCALIGRVDDGDAFDFSLGKDTTIRAYGHLRLLCNDLDRADNAGHWMVTIELVR
jgi:hypothetical protein